MREVYGETPAREAAMRGGVCLQLGTGIGKGGGFDLMILFWGVLSLFAEFHTNIVL